MNGKLVMIAAGIASLLACPANAEAQTVYYTTPSYYYTAPPVVQPYVTYYTAPGMAVQPAAYYYAPAPTMYYTYPPRLYSPVTYSAYPTFYSDTYYYPRAYRWWR